MVYKILLVATELSDTESCSVISNAIAERMIFHCSWSNFYNTPPPGGLVLHYRYQKLTWSLRSKLDLDHLYIFKYYQAHPISCATCPRLGACWSVTTKGKTKPIYSMVVTVPICVPSFPFPGDVALIIEQPKKFMFI